VITTKFPLPLLDIHYFYDITGNAVRNRWMEKYLLVQLDHRVQMLTSCGVEVRHQTRMTEVSDLIFNKIQCRLFLFTFLVFFVKYLFCAVLLACLPFHWYVAMCPAHHNPLNLTTLTIPEGKE
jgi:hypothetical protein